jgi:cobalt/nickel transport system permease protein
MHLPDGFLDPKTAIAGAALAAAGVGIALRAVRRGTPERRVPLIGLAAAFVFAAQMLNFPVAGGTSGHLIGAVLVAVLLGPSAAVLALTAVLVVQCFVFADGGVTALGANVFNMAIVAPGVGYAVFALARRLAGDRIRGLLFATAFAAWCSTVAAAVVCAGELALSRTVAWNAAFPAMTGIHMLIGLGEAVITTLIVAAVARARPELVAPVPAPGREARVRELPAYGLLVSLGLVVFVAPFASGWPDGLEKVAAALGFASRAANPVVAAPLPDYSLPGFGSAPLSMILAGVVGTLVAFVLAYVLARVLTRSSGTVPRPGSGRLSSRA